MSAMTLAMNLDHLAAQMSALGNKTRLGVYIALVRAGAGGIAVGEVQKKLGVPSSTLTHHLHKLILAGLAQQERKGTTLLCRANFDVLETTFNYFSRQCCAEQGCPETTNKSEKVRTV